MYTSEGETIKNSIIISLCYCVLFTMIHISYISWDNSFSRHIMYCVLLFVSTLLIGCVVGGLVGSLLQGAIPDNMKSWKYVVVLLLCNLLAPVCEFLIYRYPHYYN
jgi:phosphotransferase system  glucose/maltose/N-acetylglucosamine-specific IIC component